MNTMYDSVSPGEIPADATLVAGYIDGRYKWEPGDWGRFPHATKVRIAVFASTDDGRVLDVEKGDATPAEAPGWVTRRRASTGHPLSGPATVYTSLSNWQSVKDEFTKQGVAEPDWWIAEYGTNPVVGSDPVVPEGAVAKQYRSQTSPNVDTSVTLDTWPNKPAAAPQPTPQPQPLEDFDMAVITTDPNNNGKIILDPNTGHYYGISNPAVEAYYLNDLGVKEVPAPTAEVFAHFTQDGTV